MEIEPDLTICTVAEHRPLVLRRLLRSIQETADPISFEIMVVETRTGLASELLDEFPGMTVIHAPGQSRPASLNRAILFGHGRYAALLDPELVIMPGCLKRLVDFMDDTPDVGLASPRIAAESGEVLAAAGEFPGAMAMLFGPSRRDHASAPTQTATVDWCYGGFHLIRRECLDEIGLLDDTMPAWAELDYYHRAGKHGWHTMYVAEATAVHTNPGRLQSRPQAGRMERVRCLKRRWLA